MNKHRKISCARILVLILLVLLLTSCAPAKPAAKKTPLPPTATPTSGEQQVGATDSNQLPPTYTPTGEGGVEAPTPTPSSDTSTGPTETPAPTEAPAAPGAAAPTSTPVFTATSAPAAAADVGETYEAIPGCARSRLYRGDVVRVAKEIKYVTIRKTADTHPKDNIIRRLYRTELAKIVGNPVCNYGWILWPVQTADGTRGWIPESNGTDFWLVRYYSWSFPTPTIPSR